MKSILSLLPLFKIHDFVEGWKSLLKTHQFILKNGMMKYVIGIGFIFFLLFGAYMFVAWELSSVFIHWINSLSWWQAIKNTWSWTYWIVQVMEWLMKIIFIYLFVILYKYIVLIIGSPMFAFLSEKTDEKYTGRVSQFSIAKLFKDIIRGVILAVRNMVRQSIFTLFFIILSLLPVVGWIAPWIIIRKDWYYYGCSMLDYSCERYNMNVNDSISFMKNHNVLAMMNGMIFYILLLIPILGAFIAPTYCSIAATIAFLEIRQKDQYTLHER